MQQMNRVLLLLYILGINYVAFSQELIIYGSVIDKKTELPLPFSVVKAFPSKSATLTDSLGGFSLELLNSDKFIEISSTGYQKSRIDRNNIKEQSTANKITIPLKSLFLDFEEITVRAPEGEPLRGSAGPFHAPDGRSCDRSGHPVRLPSRGLPRRRAEHAAQRGYALGYRITR